MVIFIDSLRRTFWDSHVLKFLSLESYLALLLRGRFGMGNKKRSIEKKRGRLTPISSIEVFLQGYKSRGHAYNLPDDSIDNAARAMVYMVRKSLSEISDDALEDIYRMMEETQRDIRNRLPEE